MFQIGSQNLDMEGLSREIFSLTLKGSEPMNICRDIVVHRPFRKSADVTAMKSDMILMSFGLPNFIFYRPCKF